MAENIANENNELSKKAAPVQVKATQQVAVIDTEGQKPKLESVTLKDISKFVKDDIGFSYQGTSVPAGEHQITDRRRPTPPARWVVSVMK